MQNPIESGGRRRRWRAALVGVILLLLAVAAVYRYVSPAAEPAYRTAVVELGSIEKTVTSLGKLKPRDYVDVGTQVSGQLKTVHVEIGDRVEKGQLLAEIDPTVYRIRVQSSRANLARLTAQLAQQRAERALASQQLTRNRRLLAADAMSQATVEEGEAALRVADARVESLRAEIAAAESNLEGDVTNLGYTKIHAPMGGTVVSESALEGQTVNASQSAPVIVRVANLRTMTVWAQVAEADIVKLRPGMAAYFTTLGAPERRWQGTVRQLLPTPEIVNDVVLYNVLIDADNAEQALMSDMTAQVFFLLDEAREVPVVPLAALTPVAGEEQLYRARLLTPEGPRERRVRVGLQSRNLAQVLEGLKPGDEVVLGEQQAGAAAGARPRMRARL